MHQHRYYAFWMIGSNLAVTLPVGWYTGAYLTSFLFVWALRMFLCHHCTWFINSLAHYWGARTFSREQSAVDNFILSVMTFGEGYHNYHHTFARDYRNGVRWYHFDPTKWFIWLLSRLGLATSLNRIPAHRINRKLVIEKRADALEQLQHASVPSKERLAQRVQVMADELLHLFQRLQKLPQDAPKRLLLERQLKQQRKSWSALTRAIYRSRGKKLSLRGQA